MTGVKPLPTQADMISAHEMYETKKSKLMRCVLVPLVPRVVVVGRCQEGPKPVIVLMFE
jgi:hypothetical protein